MSPMRFLAGCSAVSIAAWITFRVYAGINFEWECESLLKRAADASMPQMAAAQLALALDYLDDRKITSKSGYTSIWRNTPDEHVGYWRANLDSAYAFINLTAEDPSSVARTNGLMRFRQTILDEGGEISITAPEGISIFPHNKQYAWWLGLSVFLFIIGYWLGSLNDSEIRGGVRNIARNIKPY